jgi:hypothetical protein
MPGLYYATYRGHEYRIERMVNLAYQVPTWMLTVDGDRPNDCFTTYGEAKQAAQELAEESPVKRYAKIRTLQVRRQMPGQTELDALFQDRITLERYLPPNYRTVNRIGDHWYIEGEDNAGWTLDGYVLPRLGSGLIFGEEVTGVPA